MMRTILAWASLLGVIPFVATSHKKPARAQAGKHTKREKAAAPARSPGGKAAPAPPQKGAAMLPVSGVKTEPPAPPPKPQSPIAAPGLFTPRPDAVAESLTPEFRWFYVGGATHYELVWSADAHFHKVHILLTNQTAAALPPEQALATDTVYVWRVRGGNEGGWGPWSVTQTFRTPEE